MPTRSDPFMLSALRAFAKSPIATALLAILIVSFGIWGVRDVFRSGGFTDQVVKAQGRQPVTKAQFKQAFDDARASQAQQGQPPMSAEDAVKNGVDRYVAEQLASTEALGALVSAEGINPADQLIAGELRKITAFFNPVTGQFDKDVYERQLQARHLTPAQADAEFHDVVAQRHYISGLAAGLKAPRIYGLVQAALMKQGADFQWFLVGPNTVPVPAKPTDAQITDWLKTRQRMRPEQRQLTLVNISAARLAQTIAAPDAEVQKKFDFEKDTLSTPEKRTVVQVSIKDAATGARVADQLEAGGNPMTIAKAVGGQATTYPSMAKAEIVDPKIAEVAFSMKAGEVSAPIQGALGLAVIKVVDIAPAKPATLADARPKIEAELKQNLAKKKVYELVQKYQDAHSGGSPMADAAKAAGVDAIALPSPITADGSTLDGRRASIPPKVLQQAFSLPQGGESEAIEASPNEFWVVRVEKVLPSALFALDDRLQSGTVRDLAGRQMMIDDLNKRLKDKADDLVAEIGKGKTLDAAAAEVGTKTAQASAVTRAAAQQTAPGQPPEYAPEFIGKLFQAKPGEVVTGPSTHGGVIVARLGKFDEAPPEILAAMAEQGRDGVNRAVFGDILEGTAIAARSRTKTAIDMAQARQALGIDTDSGSKPKP